MIDSRRSCPPFEYSRIDDFRAGCDDSDRSSSVLLETYRYGVRRDYSIRGLVLLSTALFFTLPDEAVRIDDAACVQGETTDRDEVRSATMSDILCDRKNNGGAVRQLELGGRTSYIGARGISASLSLGSSSYGKVGLCGFGNSGVRCELEISSLGSWSGTVICGLFRLPGGWEQVTARSSCEGWPRQRPTMAFPPASI